MGFLERLADASKHAGEFPLDQILRRLRNHDNLCDVAKDFGLLPDAEEEQHLRRDWYGGPHSWWPNYPVEGRVREGYIELLGIVREKRLPVQALWIEGSLDFVVRTSVSDIQITFLIFTPPRRGRPDPLKIEDEPWLRIRRPRQRPTPTQPIRGPGGPG